MPNTPALVNQGCSVYVRGSKTTQNDADITQSLLQSIGTSEEITEDMMDTVTALSGSGPAYVFVMIEALADGAVKMGLFESRYNSEFCSKFVEMMHFHYSALEPQKNNVRIQYSM